MWGKNHIYHYCCDLHHKLPIKRVSGEQNTFPFIPKHVHSTYVQRLKLNHTRKNTKQLQERIQGNFFFLVALHRIQINMEFGFY